MHDDCTNSTRAARPVPATANCDNRRGRSAGGERHSPEVALTMSDPEHAGGYGGALLIEAGAVLASSLDVAIDDAAGGGPPRSRLRRPLRDRPRRGERLDRGGRGHPARPGIAAGLEDCGAASRWIRRAGIPSRGSSGPASRSSCRAGAGMLRTFTDDPEHAQFMLDHDYRSAIVTPLVANGRTVGALSVLRLGESASSASARRRARAASSRAGRRSRSTTPRSTRSCARASAASTRCSRARPRRSRSSTRGKDRARQPGGGRPARV